MPLEFALAAVAMLALTLSVVWDLPVRGSALAASDFKTLYASAWCFRHGIDSYTFSNLQAVFQAQGVVQPATWYGHAPVYPPTTLAVLAPLTLVSMVHAVYVVIALSALLMACALAALLRYADESFGMTPVEKGVVIALFCATPLLGFGLTLGNVSVAAAALCIFAFARRKESSPWVAAIALALALLLKPHLALWMLLALLVLPERRDRAVTVRAAGLATAAGLGAVLFVARDQLGMQALSFVHMVRSEVAAGGSMSSSSHELLPVVSQVTSLQSLLSFWGSSPALNAACLAVLLVLGGILVWQTRLVRSERGALLAAGAWSAFGMLTTYHRAHDATMLLLLTPWVVDRVRRAPRTWQAWGTAGLYVAMCVGPQMSTVAQMAEGTRRTLAGFIVLRQAALADAAIVVILLSRMMANTMGVRSARVSLGRVGQRLGARYQKSVSTVAPSDVTATTSQ